MARQKELPKRLTREEAAALLAVPSRRAPTGVRNRALLRLFYRAGLRCNEALELAPRDVVLSRNEIRVNRGKGGKDRVVWYDNETVEVLDRWKQIRPRSPWFFCTLAGGRVDNGYVRAMAARYGRRAGIETRVHPHRLRHSFACELLEDNIVPLHGLQKLMGHDRLETTQLYLHIVDDDLHARMAGRD